MPYTPDSGFALATRRDLTETLDLHGLRPELLAGKIIYDLGCGYSDLGAELAACGIAATVYGFDENPEVFDPLDTHEAGMIPIIGSLADLQVPDASADIVLATYSLPMHARNQEEIQAFFAEAQRVVRVGGWLAIYPFVISTVERNREPRDENVRLLLTDVMEAEVTKLEAAPDWRVQSRHTSPWRQGITAQKAVTVNPERISTLDY
jgi:ubiquinone/menaquinone biosynthesis C-methylase UbiE